MYKNKLIILCIAFFSLVTGLNAATVYKWVDEDGQVHYGNKAQHKSAKEVEIKNRYIDTGKKAPPALSAQERVNNQQKFLDALDEDNKVQAAAKKKKREQEDLKISRCHASRDQLKRAESASALYDLDEKGNRILLNKKQYEQAMAQAKARVDKWCN